MHDERNVNKEAGQEERYEQGLKSWSAVRWSGAGSANVSEVIAEEMPLTIHVNGQEFATVLCSPVGLEPLVYGFLASEGLIRTADEVKQVRIDRLRGIADVTLYAALSPDAASSTKRFIGSCCGKSREFYFQHDARTAKTYTRTLRISAEACYRLIDWLHTNSDGFAMSGGLHNAGLCTVGEGLFTHCDIGRHNALDKLYGTCLLERIPVGDKVIVFSGRLSSEVILKAAKIGVGAIITKSAPTDLALRLADDLGITAVGFARSGKMNVYTHHSRIVSNQDMVK